VASSRLWAASAVYLGGRQGQGHRLRRFWRRNHPSQLGQLAVLVQIPHPGGINAATAANTHTTATTTRTRRREDSLDRLLDFNVGVIRS
jgi:hypothetical protein